MADNIAHSADPGAEPGTIHESSFLLRPAWASQLTDEQERKGTFAIVASALFTSSFFSTFIIPLLPLFHYKQNLTLYQTSAVFASFGLGELAAAPILSLLAGQIKCWLLMCISMLFLTLYGVAFMSTESEFGIIFTARFLGGVASGVGRTCAFAIVDDMYLPSERSQRNVVLYFCMAFGLTTGPLLGGSFAADDSFYSAMLGSIASGGLIGAIYYIMRNNTVELPKTEPLMSQLRHMPTLLSLGTITLVGATIAFTEVVLPLHLTAAFNSSPAAVGGLFMIVSISYIFMANLTAILAEKVNRNFMLTLGLVGTALACVTLTAPPDLAVEVIPVLILGASSSVVCAAALLRLVETTHEGDIRALTFSQSIWVARATGVIVGPLLFALMSDTMEMGNDGAAYAFGAVTIAAAVALAVKLRDEPPSEEDSLTVPVIADLQLQFTM